MKIYILQNGCEDNFDSNEVYGVYSSQEKAIEARKKAESIPGYRTFPHDWEINAMELDQFVRHPA